jgi:hypothetical protein
VAAAPVELVRLLHGLRPRHRRDLGLCEPERDLGEGWADGARENLGGYRRGRGEYGVFDEGGAEEI